jgi:hypothetical protein
MGWKIFRIPKVEVGPPGLKVTAERVAPEREVPYPLMVALSDKRAILDFYGRADTPYVTDSIRGLRTEINGTLTALGPDAAAGPLLVRIRSAIHEYLTAVEAEHDEVLFGAALRDLRTIIRDVATRIADAYRLDIAAELVAAMDAADAAADPYTRQFYEDPIAAVKGAEPS